MATMLPRKSWGRPGWGWLWSALAACADQGSGVVFGPRLELASCEELDDRRVFEPFRLELDFLGTERDYDVVVLELAPRGQLWPSPDTLAITVEDVDQVQAEIAELGQATRFLGDGVRVGLALMRTCPRSTDALVGTGGSATFFALGYHRGDRVKADLAFDLLEVRSTAVVGSGFQATIDFEVDLGSPQQQFIDPDEQHL
jgi:hypothetical protein